jgi:formylglycine-generating enzyme required for sulfatase activity
MSTNWAICIGINEYDNLKPLQYAQADAEQMRDFCQDEAGFETVYFFAKDAPPIETERGPGLKSAPTYGALMNFLYRRFQTPFLSLGDDLWFFFAGHGRRHQGQDYLMLSDSNPLDVEKTAIPLQYITQRLRNSGASNIILMLDACRNEDDRGGVGIGYESQKGVVSFYACSPEESSYEIEALQQGAFTYSLLKGLRGNCTTVKQLDEYLREQVPWLNQQHHQPRQTPYTSIEPLTKQNLILLSQRATPEDAAVLKLDALKAEVSQDYAVAEHLWAQVLVVLPGDLDAIAAIKRIAQTETVSSLQISDVEPSKPIAAQEVEQTAKPAPAISKPIVPTFELETVTVNSHGSLLDRRKELAEYPREDLDNGIVLEVVLIPSGTFSMGSPIGKGHDSEKPQHSVKIQPFLMGKYPVTQAQWKAVAAFPQVEHELESDPAYFKGSNRPVESISWDDAVEFCKRLSQKTGRDYRLPSEAEWEYACRAGTTTLYHFGDTITGEQVNCDFRTTVVINPGFLGFGRIEEKRGPYRANTTEVGRFPANAFGLYDMHGNVWEWCSDHWHENYKGAPDNGSAWTEGGDASLRVLRGGSWNHDSGYCRPTFRNWGPHDFKNYNLGFRVVCASPWTL